jgi:hypothetical protein
MRVMGSGWKWRVMGGQNKLVREGFTSTCVYACVGSVNTSLSLSLFLSTKGTQDVSSMSLRNQVHMRVQGV